MKRLFAIALLCVVALLAAPGANAVKYGVVGGATFSSIKGIGSGSQTGWHAGGTAQFKLPIGFSVQPSLLYNSKLESTIEVPVSLQWGPDLLVFRPFVDISPYVGYRFSSIDGIEYGLGIGGGLEVWRFQVICRYNWNLESTWSKYRGVTLSLAFLFGK